jgi:hypothetical protein
MAWEIPITLMFFRVSNEANASAGETATSRSECQMAKRRAHRNSLTSFWRWFSSELKRHSPN